ncbi:MAG: hypothetical protein WBA88_14490 [Pseudaminobacter sp.]
MSAPVITERHIDQMYTIIETLSLCSIVLADGNLTDKTAGSISWLTGQMKEGVGEILTLMEEIQSAGLKAAPARKAVAS